MNQEEQNKITIERLNRILGDLQYELTRGLHQGHIVEELHGQVFLHDKHGKVWRFRFDLIGTTHEFFRYSDHTRGNKLELVKG